MIKKIHLLLIACLISLLIFPSLSQAQGEITVLESTAQVEFPQAVTFSLEAQSTTDIIEVVLFYAVDKISLFPVTGVVKPEFVLAPDVEVSWTWDMRMTGGLPPGAELRYWWLIKDSAGNELETAPAFISFDDQRYAWSSLTAGEVTLFWYEGDLYFAEQLMAAANQALDTLAQDTGAYLEQPVSIYIYATFQDLLGALVYPQEWTGGVAFTEYGVVVLGVPSQYLAWGKGALAHELTHLLIHQMTFNPYGALPTWLDEGLATYAEGALYSGYHSRLNTAVSEDSLISVQSLCSNFPASSEEAELAYAESYSIAKFLITTYGREKMLHLLTVFKQGSSYDEALLEVYGFDIEELDAKWRSSLGLEPRPALTSAARWQSIPPTPEAGEEAALSSSTIALILTGAMSLVTLTAAIVVVLPGRRFGF